MYVILGNCTLEPSLLPSETSRNSENVFVISMLCRQILEACKLALETDKPILLAALIWAESGRQDSGLKVLKMQEVYFSAQKEKFSVVLSVLCLKRYGCMKGNVWSFLFFIRTGWQKFIPSAVCLRRRCGSLFVKRGRCNGKD